MAGANNPRKKKKFFLFTSASRLAPRGTFPVPKSRVAEEAKMEQQAQKQKVVPRVLEEDINLFVKILNSKSPNENMQILHNTLIHKSGMSGGDAVVYIRKLHESANKMIIAQETQSKPKKPMPKKKTKSKPVPSSRKKTSKKPVPRKNK